MGGEKNPSALACFGGLGSPPHGRGKVEDMRKAGLNPRITPAWAGKRLTVLLALFLLQDHPRMGGEKWYEFGVPFTLLGSPPHGRGKVL